jgi:hypothetical protein
MRFAGAAALLIAAGCSSNGSSPSDASTEPARDAAVETGAVDGAGQESGTEAGGGPTTGSITVIQNVTSAGDFSQVAIALDRHYASGAACSSSTSGPCTIEDCTAEDSPDAGPSIDESAGTITLTGGAFSMPLMLPFDTPQGQYRPALVPSAIFTAGQVFDVSAPGAQYPGFSGKSAPAPATIVISSPALVDGGLGPTYLFDPTAPLAWSWTNGSAGSSVTFTLVTSSPDLIITCTFDAAGGSGTIPQDVVAMFPSIPTDVQIASISTSLLPAGDQSVLFELESSAPAANIAPQ